MSARTGLDFYITAPHECSYLPDRDATTLFADPEVAIDTRLYSALANHGFRRSGSNVYRPQCTDCDACVAVRVPVDRFVPSRNQRRVVRRNADLSVRAVPASFVPEHFELYLRYIHSRHAGSSMDSPDSARYVEFLISPTIDTVFYELREGDRLLGVAVVDRLHEGLSAVYTFFDPDEKERSLGTYAILMQMREAQRLGLPWVYLGYWIKACTKMSYKDRFRPFEGYRNGRWVPDHELLSRP
jgi:arginine-tRNA-protein transferase